MRRPLIDKRYAVVVLATGVVAGAGGVVLTLLLHLVQHLAFGYTESSFLVGVEKASPLRRVLAPALGGLIVGSLWWALRRRCTPCSVETALSGPDRRLSLPVVAADASLQIIAVGFGASLGREGAPRQLGAALAGYLVDWAGLSVEHRRRLIACGAGAGLAAVYDVPLGGALFTLEILLVSAAVADVVPALISSAIATAMAWPVLSDRPTYQVTPPSIHGPILLVALVIGPLAGLAGVGFTRVTTLARSFAPSGWRLPVMTTLVFGAVGAAAIYYPQLPGNGKGPAQLAFDGTLAVGTAAILMILKPLATAACLASGANGGLLTPALATGALLGAVIGEGATSIWPGTPISAYAMIGAATLLAVTQRAPLCAIVLVLEFTHTGLALLVPIIVAVAGAMTVRYLLSDSP